MKINAFTTYAVIFLLSITLYNSDIAYSLLPLSDNTKLLILITSAISLLWGSYFTIIFKKKTINQNIPTSLFFYIEKLFFLSLFLTAIQIILQPNLPIIEALKGAESHKYFVSSYGVPLLFPILLNLLMITAILYSYLLLQNFSNRKKLISRIIFSFLILFVFFSRGTIALTLISIFFLYLNNMNKSNFRIIYLLIFGLVSVYLFGLMGNVRVQDSNFILRIAGVNSELFQKKIPSEFFWTYIYITSPLSNLEFTVITSSHHQFNFISLFSFDMLPDLISKYFIDLSSWRLYRPIVIDAFTVGTIYARPIFNSGIFGAYIIFFVLLFFLTLIYLIKINSSILQVYNSLLCTFSFICIFTNPLVFTGTILPLVILFIFEFFLRRQLNE